MLASSRSRALETSTGARHDGAPSAGTTRGLPRAGCREVPAVASSAADAASTGATRTRTRELEHRRLQSRRRKNCCAQRRSRSTKARKSHPPSSPKAISMCSRAHDLLTCMKALGTARVLTHERRKGL